MNLERGVGRPAHVARAEAPTLERIQQLTTLLGSPQLDVPTIHITGTNGKTSTVRLIASLLRSHGSKVGTYTSPNLERINDRMSIDGVDVDDRTLDELLRTVALAEPHMDEPPSYFEILTAAALYWFSDEAVDVAVVEVGLGGTWDATNVVDADVAVITNVAIDHVEYLGPTRESIARDKAGIITPMSSLVLGETDPELVEIFAAREPQQLKLRHRDFDVTADRIAVGGRALDLVTPSARYNEVFLALHGSHQADNAALALTAAELWAGAPLDDDAVRHAYATVTSPGRMEFVARQPLVVLDGAHNVAGARALRDALDEELGPMPRTVLMGLLKEKDPTEMLAAFGLDGTRRLVLCRPPSPRALDPEIVAQAAVAMGFDADAIDVVDDVRSAVGTAMLETPDDGQLVITGSLYVVGAARSIFVS